MHRIRNKRKGLCIVAVYPEGMSYIWCMRLLALLAGASQPKLRSNNLSLYAVEDQNFRWGISRSDKGLSHQGHEKLDTPLDVLDALEACAAKGAARALCALAASSFRAATLLGMTCEEAASLGPCQSLQVLLMKGPQAAPVSPI